MRPDARNFERSEVSKIRGLGPHPVVRGTVNAQVSACAYACALRRILNVYRGVGDAYSYVRGAFDYTFRYLWGIPCASRISSVRATTRGRFSWSGMLGWIACTSSQAFANALPYFESMRNRPDMLVVCVWFLVGCLAGPVWTKREFGFPLTLRAEMQVCVW